MNWMRTLMGAILIVVLSGSVVSAQTLPLPDTLVDLRSDKGEQLLKDSDEAESFTSLVSNFVTQKTQAFCGVASIVMVLNALQLSAPAVPEYDPYKTFTQDNFLSVKTEPILPAEVLAKQGMTLDQIGALLGTQPVKVEVVHAANSTIESFRKSIREHLAQNDQFVIVNYLRKAIGQEKGGHISPLGAYDAETDRVLILDVSRYKYPPVWVTTEDLFRAMNTTDSDNENKTRGYVLISKTDQG